MAIVDRIAPHLGRALALRQWLSNPDNPDQREEVALLAFGVRRTTRAAAA